VVLKSKFCFLYVICRFAGDNLTQKPPKAAKKYPNTTTLGQGEQMPQGKTNFFLSAPLFRDKKRGCPKSRF